MIKFLTAYFTLLSPETQRSDLRLFVANANKILGQSFAAVYLLEVILF